MPDNGFNQYISDECFGHSVRESLLLSEYKTFIDYS